jgi:hypothetical protein
MITAGEEVRDAVFAATILREPPFQFDRQLPFLLEHFVCQSEDQPHCPSSRGKIPLQQPAETWLGWVSGCESRPD